MPNSLLIGSPDVNVQAFTCYHLLYHVVIVFCLCTYSVNLCCIGVPIVWRSSVGLRQCRVVRYCIVGCRDKCNEVCAAIKTISLLSS